MKEKLAIAPDERRSIEQLHLNNMKLLEYDQTDKKNDGPKRWQLVRNVWCCASGTNLKKLR